MVYHNVLIKIECTTNLPVKERRKYIPILPSDLALWLTLISSNYPCLEHIFMVQKVFKPLKFYCICKNITIFSYMRSFCSAKLLTFFHTKYLDTWFYRYMYYKDSNALNNWAQIIAISCLLYCRNISPRSHLMLYALWCTLLTCCWRRHWRKILTTIKISDTGSL